MKLHLRLATAFLGIALPIAALAVAPGSVSGLSGNAQPDGSIIIRWTLLPDPTIVLYRLYYSAESILDSEGLYDDYEETEGPVSEFIFYSPPKQASLFVTVLAVNSSGEESEAFAEEVRVDIPKKPAQPIAAPAPIPAPVPVPVSPPLTVPTPTPTPIPAPAGAASSSAFSIDVQIPSLEEIQQLILNAANVPQPTAVQSSSAAAVPPPKSSAAPVVAPVISSSSSSLPPPVLTLPSSTPAATAPSAAVPTLTAPPQDGKVHLLIAEALSPIQVKLTMSTAVAVEPTGAPQAFRIEGPNGTDLHITQLLISDKLVILDTVGQQKGVTYTVRLSEPLMGTAGEPLDLQDRSAVFTGHELGSNSVSAPATTANAFDPMLPTDVTGFRLRAVPDAGGKTYTVTAQWQPDLSRTDLAYYLVSQSLDGGATFSEPEMAPMDIGGIEIKGAQPGELGISLRVVNIYGKTSAGVFDKVTLPGEVPARTPFPSPAPSLPPSTSLPPTPALSPEILAMIRNSQKPRTIPTIKEAHTDRLSQSGIGLFAVGSSMIGSFVGWKRAKKIGAGR